MVLARQFTIGLLDLVLRGGSGDAQDVVVISLRGRHRGTRLSFVLAAYGVRAVFSRRSYGPMAERSPRSARRFSNAERRLWRAPSSCSRSRSRRWWAGHQSCRGGERLWSSLAPKQG